MHEPHLCIYTYACICIIMNTYMYTFVCIAEHTRVRRLLNSREGSICTHTRRNNCRPQKSVDMHIWILQKFVCVSVNMCMYMCIYV